MELFRVKIAVSYTDVHWQWERLCLQVVCLHNGGTTSADMDVNCYQPLDVSGMME